MGALLRCGLLVTLFTLVFSTEKPGVKLRITQNGINYANGIVQQVLTKELRALRITDQSGKDGRITWWLRNIQNRGVTAPSSRLSFDPANNALAWSLTGLGISLRADYRIKYKRGWIKASNSGSVEAGVSGVSAAVSVRLGANANGRPTLTTASCSASIGGVRVKFRGSLAWLINLFRRPMERKVRKLLEGQICKQATKIINVDGNKALAKLKVNVELDKQLILDYGLSSAPKVTSSYLDIRDKGEVYWKTNKRTPPFTPNNIPPLSETSRMLYLWVTEYPPKTALYAAHNNGYLKLDISKDDLKGKNKDLLDTTCEKICIGDVIPVIGDRYPNRQVRIVVSSNSVPEFAITPRGISLSLGGDIDMYADASGQRSAFLLTLNMTMSLSVSAKIVNERLVGEINNYSFKLGFVRSTVGSFDPEKFNDVVKVLTNLVVVPYANSIVRKGTDLPVTEDIKFRNTQLRLLQGSILVATDITYNYSK